KDAQITPRHLQLLQLLHRYRFLDTDHILALYKAYYGIANSNVRDALTDLFHEHQLVDRIPARAFNRSPLNDPVVCELNANGLALLQQRGLLLSPATWLKGGRFGTKSLSSHNLRLCHFMASVEAAAKDAGLRFITCYEILAKAPADTRQMDYPFVFPIRIEH